MSVVPKATESMSALKGTAGFFSSGFESISSVSQTPTASTITKPTFDLASGVTAWKSASLMTRTPRPFICSKKFRDFTDLMNITTSSGFTSVPVAIMSTVTTIRGLKLFRKEESRSSALVPVDL